MASAAITTIAATTALPETESGIAIQSRGTVIASERKSLNPSKNRIANALTSATFPTMRSPLPAALLHSSLTAVQIRHPSGGFHSILNVAAAAVNASDLASLTGALAIDHHDLMGRSLRCRRSHRQRTMKSEQLSGKESRDHSCANSTDYSEGADSTTSSSSTASTILRIVIY
ncbi:hypothetical protein CK203_017249 [Vitis vinifera]|uniref:Uncharacterized protein n=1 Tax=Vitis vinifera TaxID=29760 RepID=A0A438JZS2_VITVI|nr:hypothetical protein CK203_017249 [Vitis vinifera]